MIESSLVDLSQVAAGELDDEWLLRDHRGPVEATTENVEAARIFALDRWRERAEEYGLPVPADLSGACKFCALFAKSLFGGSIDGHYDHIFNRIGGEVLDLSAASADVAGLRDPYRSDPGFLASEDLHYSLETCVPRVLRWVAAFQRPASPGPRA